MSDVVKIYRDRSAVLDFEAIRRYSPALITARQHITEITSRLNFETSTEIENARITTEGIVFWTGLRVKRDNVLIYLCTFGYKHNRNTPPPLAYPVKAEFPQGDEVATMWFQKSWQRLAVHMQATCGNEQTG